MSLTNQSGSQHESNHHNKRHPILDWLLCGFSVLLVSYVLLAYMILPAAWRHYEHNPTLMDAPKTTFTSEGFPGDPLNGALIGSEAEVVRAFLVAGWYPADPTTVRSAMRITESVLLDRSYPTAPMSSLYLWGRRQDLSFECPHGRSPKHRHHVRFWLSDKPSPEGRPQWLGAATYDCGVGLSHRTAQVTHHIVPDVDTERDKVIADLAKAAQLVRVYQVTGVGQEFQGRNGGGDWYYTDGEMTVGVLAESNQVQVSPPAELPSPPLVQVKNSTGSWLRQLFVHFGIFQGPLDSSEK